MGARGTIAGTAPARRLGLTERTFYRKTHGLG
jgi:hypothetical protein